VTGLGVKVLETAFESALAHAEYQQVAADPNPHGGKGNEQPRRVAHVSRSLR
jgi:hypothetical protein